MMTIQNANRSCHVTICATPFLSIGGKEEAPPKETGEPPTVVLVAPRTA